MDEPPTPPNARPPVPMGMHRRARRRRLARQWGRWTAIVLTIASILLAIFVHRGLLGIAGLVGAVVVAYVMLRPSQWLRPDDEDDVTEARAD